MPSRPLGVAAQPLSQVKAQSLSGPPRSIVAVGVAAAVLRICCSLSALIGPADQSSPASRGQDLQLRGEQDAPFAALMAWPAQANLAAPSDVARQDYRRHGRAPHVRPMLASWLGEPVQPFSIASADDVDRSRALACLTTAVYYEAGNQSADGQAAVAQVVLNRVRHPLFPKTICGVVFQGSALRTGCQFSFTCDGSLNRRPDPVGWKRASAVAARALNGHVQSRVGEATHFHTVWAAPYWRSGVVRLTRIGAHIFYHLPGVLGRPGAFVSRYAGSEAIPPQIAGLDEPPPPASTASSPSPPASPATAQPAAPALVAPEVHPLQISGLVPGPRGG